MIRICHLTSAHPRNDIRIFIKQCRSLAEAGYDLNFIVADGKGNEVKNDIKIFDVGKPDSRIKRMIFTTKKVYQRALSVDAKLYHFHDPELIPIGLKLLKKGKKVIYDVHEDVPRQILSKTYLFGFIKTIISISFEIYENSASKKFSYILTATPGIKNRFMKININTIDINNYPILVELQSDIEWKNKKNAVSYVGGISKTRGIEQIVSAMENIDCILYLAGNFENDNLRKKVIQRNGWKNVEECGYIDREQTKQILRLSKAGIVTLLSTPNHIESQPIKMFEYMSASIPVIASNFDLWKEIIENNNCGLCVNPENPKEIAEAIQTIISNDELAERMGRNGRVAVKEKYNWTVEEQKLFDVYKKISLSIKIT